MKVYENLSPKKLLELVKSGDYTACYYLSLCLRYGIGVKINEQLADTLFKKALKNDVPEALCAHAESCFENGLYSDMEHSYVKAFISGDKKAYLKLADRLSEKFKEDDNYIKASVYFNKAIAESGLTKKEQGQVYFKVFRLNMLHSKAVKNEKYTKRAYNALEKAIEYKNPDAMMLKAGELFKGGYLAPSDSMFSNAFSLLKKSSERMYEEQSDKIKKLNKVNKIPSLDFDETVSQTIKTLEK